ncbi:hypothetical protein RFI_26054 [Reticulomyxa filosa]|uniref:Mon2/Sec7/BIG1-like dimerisation and cyclophilin-binding domain-containing protein n=1 Tax=Reticulomyxa filosa TaxID=46433 RepID=X6ME54_RETFI|nr:hypothetical protein RFI_26054 [Reticulomyxa filosa]|eukprot:ETO11320.1 hypothetical protein RFI_26054 [Reticulomyxa filosa]
MQKTILPLCLACETAHSAVVEISLDGIQKLVAGEYLFGNIVLSTMNGKAKRLIDSIVETVCECCHINTPSTQLALIKTLLIIGTSAHCEVHNETLKLLIVTCYMLYLNTKNFDVQTSGMLFFFLIAMTQFISMDTHMFVYLYVYIIETTSNHLKTLESTTNEQSRNQAETKDGQNESKETEEKHNNDLTEKGEGKTESEAEAGVKAKIKDEEEEEEEEEELESSDGFEKIQMSQEDETVKTGSVEIVSGNGSDHTYELESNGNENEHEHEHENVNRGNGNGNANGKDESVALINIVKGILNEIIETVAEKGLNESKMEVDEVVVDEIGKEDNIDTKETSKQEIVFGKKRGNQCYSKGHHREALVHYKKAQELNPRHPAYLVNQAVTHYVLDELREAKYLCVKAIEIGRLNNAHPQWNAKSFSTLAHVAYKENNIANCIRFYRLSLSEYQDHKIEKKLHEVFLLIQLTYTYIYSFFKNTLHILKKKKE